MKSEQEIRKAIELLGRVADSRGDIHDFRRKGDLSKWAKTHLDDEVYIEAMQYHDALLWVVEDLDGQDDTVREFLGKFDT